MPTAKTMAPNVVSDPTKKKPVNSSQATNAKAAGSESASTLFPGSRGSKSGLGFGLWVFTGLGQQECFEV